MENNNDDFKIENKLKVNVTLVDWSKDNQGVEYIRLIQNKLFDLNESDVISLSNQFSKTIAGYKSSSDKILFCQQLRAESSNVDFQFRVEKEVENIINDDVEILKFTSAADLTNWISKLNTEVGLGIYEIIRKFPSEDSNIEVEDMETVIQKLNDLHSCVNNLLKK